MNVKITAENPIAKVGDPKVTATINPQGISATANPPQLNVHIGAHEVSINANPSVVREYVGADMYDGEYIVIPKADTAQTLETRNKVLLDDVTVTKVPYFETSNLYGDTVYIASEV